MAISRKQHITEIKGIYNGRPNLLAAASFLSLILWHEIAKVPEGGV